MRDLFSLILVGTTVFLASLPVVSVGEDPDQPLQGDHRVSEWEFNIKMTSGHVITVTVYYPGYRGPLERYLRYQDAPFPVVVFSPGYGSNAPDYGYFLEDLASFGLIVAGASWSYERDREMDTAHIDHTKVRDGLEKYDDDPDSPL